MNPIPGRCRTGDRKATQLWKPARRRARPTLDRVAQNDAEWDGETWKLCQNEAWFKSGLQLRGGWGRRPKGNAPRSEASALGARWLLPARSQPPNYRHLRGWQRGSSRPTPHAPMTLGTNHVSRAPARG